MTEEFDLDPILVRDTSPVAALALCEVRLMNDSTYPWLVLVPRLSGAVEIADLSVEARARLIEDIAVASAALRRAVACDKLNVAALGNQVAQLHVHVIARLRTDPAWPGPVWGKVPPAPYTQAARDALTAGLRGELAG